ncbi:methyltransferase domain-containing protein [Humibacillus xanthopallidus]|uniref:Methyltransferase family protein n=1 Tax=Humibacillus xanthopallidus TaxID=412689 RepID=A0A543HXA6_9MICO|nr:methyltransferase domain-containing protein [Humibacillus xanthopallidus]TQM62977.1 methyltransferase family protein [Humibacillus xanthopallidus]
MSGAAGSFGVVAANSFLAGQDAWLRRLGNLRNVVRQEVVARQLAQHLPAPPATVLDVGAGQGTQALRLAALGHVVTAVEPDEGMRAAFDRSAADLDQVARDRVTLLGGDLDSLAASVRSATFDVVLCHGVLMYLPESRSAIRSLAERLAPGGTLSVLARNGDALAWRPASRHDWSAAIRMLDESTAARVEGRDAFYRNEIGVDARADTLASLTSACADAGLDVEAWGGVRVASDDVPVDEPAPRGAELAELLDVEERLGATDPYRALGTLLHVIARRPRQPAGS